MDDVRSRLADQAQTTAEEPGGREGFAVRRRKRGRIALSLLAVAVVVSLVLVWWLFRAYSPSAAPVSTRTHPWIFPVLLLHIVGASVALAALPLQLWPWLRRRHPRVHRSVGRTYVLAGVYPAGIGSLLLLAFWPEYPINEFSDVVTTVLWLAATTIAFRLARQHRFADHRRWMLRSFALTASFTVTLILVVPIALILRPELHSQFAGNTAVMNHVESGMDIWLSWILPLLAVEWWLDREQLRRSARRRSAVEHRESVTVE
jgi:uncharacterized membrane protein